MSMNEHMKPRVNASIMPNYLEQNVSLLGIAKNVDTSGNFFTLTTCDDQDVKIMLQEPLSQPVSGLTEVYGMVKSPDSVMCGDFIVIPEEAAKEFDMTLYLKAVEFSYSLNHLYAQGGKLRIDLTKGGGGGENMVTL